MISVWQIKLVHGKLTSGQWRVVNTDYGNIVVGEDRLEIYARDRTTLRAVWCEQVHVWVTDKYGRAQVRIIVDEDLSAVTDFHCGLGSATDFTEVLTWAQHNVVYDPDDGYLADVPAVGGRELVVQFGDEAEEADAVCA